MTQPPVITRDLTLADDWPAPRSPRVPRWVRFALPVALLSVVVAFVVAAHGLEPYRARVTYRSPGDVVTVGGVLEFAPYEALATKGDGVWRIIVFGTCRNTSDSDLLDYRFSEEAMATFEPASRTFSQSTDRNLYFGGSEHTFSSTLNPGLPTGYCRLLDELPASLTLTGHLGVAVFEVTNQDTSSSKIGNTSWVVSGTGASLYFVPLTIGT